MFHKLKETRGKKANRYQKNDIGRNENTNKESSYKKEPCRNSAAS